MPTFAIVMLIIVLVLIAIFVGLYFFGRRQQKKAAENQPKIDAAAQTYSILVIDKAKKKAKDSGLPASVVQGIPRYLRMTKLPVVKAKIGPKIVTLVADAQVYDLIPVKQEIKATVSGIYITKVKSVRGPALKAAPKKKFMDRFRRKKAN